MKSKTQSRRVRHSQAQSFFRAVRPWIFAGMLLQPTVAQAANGSGTMTVDPDSAQASSTGNNFDFLYTADEDMADGSLQLTFPDPWTDPNGSNVTVTVNNGQTGTVINSLDAANHGWNGSLTGICPGCTLTLSTDNDRFAGSGSLKAAISSGIGALYVTTIYYNFPVANDFSDFTDFSFYIRNDSMLQLDILTGGKLVLAPEPGLLGNMNQQPVEYPFVGKIIDLGHLGLGGWSQVRIDLTGHLPATRDSIKSYGFVFPAAVGLMVEKVIHFDHIMAGPADPTFDGNVMTQDFLYLDEGGTVQVAYDDITAPAAEGVYPFTTKQKISSTYYNTVALAESPTIEVTAAGDDGADNGNGGDNANGSDGATGGEGQNGSDAGNGTGGEGQNGSNAGNGTGGEGNDDDDFTGGGCALSTPAASAQFASVGGLACVIAASFLLRKESARKTDKKKTKK